MFPFSIFISLFSNRSSSRLIEKFTESRPKKAFFSANTYPSHPIPTSHPRPHHKLRSWLPQLDEHAELDPAPLQDLPAPLREHAADPRRQELRAAVLRLLPGEGLLDLSGSKIDENQFVFVSLPHLSPAPNRASQIRFGLQLQFQIQLQNRSPSSGSGSGTI